MNCERPDKDVPGITCGHPLPCPFHTVEIDVTGEVPKLSIPIPATPNIDANMLGKLKRIGQILHEVKR